MSRFCGERNVDALLSAAQNWKAESLLGERGILSPDVIWTAANIEVIHQRFVQNPDETDRPFLQKLRDQLADTGPAIKQLAAEMLWLMQLAPSNVSPEKKRENIIAIWEWSDTPFPLEIKRAYLTDQVLSGVGSAGPAFGNHRPRELEFLLNLLLGFRNLPKTEQESLASDPWKFAHWLQSIPGAAVRQLRHMLLYLLFPDDFERAFSAGDRKTIAEQFSGLSKREIGRLTAVELDEKLREIRKRLETEYGTKELDYYCSPLKERWQRDIESVGAAIRAEHVRLALQEIDRDGIPAGAHSTTYDLVEGAKRYPPKLVFSLAAKYATGAALDRSSFAGGDETNAFAMLRGLGLPLLA